MNAINYKQQGRPLFSLAEKLWPAHITPTFQNELVKVLWKSMTNDEQHISKLYIIAW